MMTPDINVLVAGFLHLITFDADFKSLLRRDQLTLLANS